MGIALSTAGILVGYATGTLTQKPTSYKELPDIKSTPDFNVEPNGLDCTVLSETVAKQYIDGLKDYGSAISFNANINSPLIKKWNDWCDDIATKRVTEPNTCGWIEIKHPKLDQASILPVSPVKIGIPGSEVDAVWETSLFATPLAGAEWVEPVEIKLDGTTEE